MRYNLELKKWPTPLKKQKGHEGDRSSQGMMSLNSYRNMTMQQSTHILLVTSLTPAYSNGARFTSMLVSHSFIW
eukprot:m.278940 g.278940  ORF g.278940 m.278940 type:complete len:74 (+) comp40616_c0_seq7:1150-1371(+)